MAPRSAIPGQGGPEATVPTCARSLAVKQIGDGRRWVMCADGLPVDISGHPFAMS
ncbi:hypothetical protein ACOJBM_34975 [Rhizobium beringeri]